MLLLTHDYTSPASAVAVARLQPLADEGLAVGFRGIDVLGLAVTIPVTLDVLAEVERVRDDAEALGLTLRRPRVQPPTTLAHLVEEVAEEAGLGAAWRRTAYRAYWEGGADLAEVDVLLPLAASAGLDTERVAVALADPARVASVRRRAAMARGEGIGGVPVLALDGTLVSPDLDEVTLRQLAAL